MTTAATTELADCITTLKKAGENALTNPHVDDFLEIERYLGQLESVVRETQQSMWSREAKDTIRRLECQEPLTPQDHDVIRTFIVSDAEHYLAQENNFGDWLSESPSSVSYALSSGTTTSSHMPRLCRTKSGELARSRARWAMM